MVEKGQRGSFDPSFGGHDARLARVMQAGEQVTSTSFGALLFNRPVKSKVYVTTLRLAVVPDDPGFTNVWSQPWLAISAVRVKKSLMAATAFVTTPSGEMGVDTTKAMAGDIERAWMHLRAVTPAFESCGVRLLPSIDVRCERCDVQLSPAVPQCGTCLRMLTWPDPLNVLAQARMTPDSFLPETFPDGSSTQRGPMVVGLAVLTAGAMCAGNAEFMYDAERLIYAIRNRTRVTADTFAPLPQLRGAGDQRDNEKFWATLITYPQRLTPA